MITMTSIEKVSNPWREAIEGNPGLATVSLKLFPILGGRLLKLYQLSNKLYYKIVSNPWREAIEEKKH